VKTLERKRAGPGRRPWLLLVGAAIGAGGYALLSRGGSKPASVVPSRVPAASLPATSLDDPDPQKLVGRWMRTDHDYMIWIEGVAPDGRLRARYLNPQPINVARAEIVDEDALYRALVDKRIAGAALDVWYRYPKDAGPTPPAHRPFHELANVLMTPHVSGWTEGMLEARAKLIAENIQRTARGEPPLNLIR